MLVCEMHGIVAESLEFKYTHYQSFLDSARAYVTVRVFCNLPQIRLQVQELEAIEFVIGFQEALC